MADVRQVKWRGTDGDHTLLITSEDWLVDGLVAKLPSAEPAPSRKEPDALIVERSALALIPDATLNAVDLHFLIDPNEDERSHVAGIKAGNRRARVVTLPSIAARGAAEHALLLMLALSRRLLAGYSAVVDGHWFQPAEGPTLAGKTLGVVGLGRSGAALAGIALGLGARIFYHDLVARDEVEARLPIERRRFDQLLRESDVVSLHLPATRDTVRLIDAPELALMKPTAILINVADGGLIDEGSLIKALRTGSIAGAALDTFAYEPLSPDSPLIGFENVVLTPRVAWMDPARERALWLEQIVESLTGA